MKPDDKITFDRYIPDIHDTPNTLEDTTPEMVDHPSHYHSSSGIEVIDAIEAWDLDFSLGNALKYIARAGLKNDRDEDLEKAKWYLMRAAKKEEDPERRKHILAAIGAIEESKHSPAITASK
jgi:hypothetical protein